MKNRRWAVTCLALLAALAGALAGVVALPATPAYAHAQLVGTSPANGARLDTAPAEIVLRFSERVLLVREGIRLLDGTGATRTTGPARLDPDGREVILPVPAGLGNGTYVVSWRVVSADSHPIHGAFAFGVGDAAVTPLPDAGALATSDPGLTVTYWLFRLLGYAALALLCGGAVFLFVCWPEGWARRQKAKAARRLLLAGWVGSVVSAAMALLIQGPYASGGTLRSLADPRLLSATFGSDFGRFVLTRLQLLAVAGVLLLFLMRGKRRPHWTMWAAGVLGVALAATWSGTGHANAQTDPLAWTLAAAADSVHLGAMAVWFGGLAFLVTALVSSAAARPVPEVALAVTRFSRLATICVGLLVATGTYQAWRGVGSLDALAGSDYGRLLVFKLATVGVLLWFGWMSRSLVHRHFQAQLSIVDASSAPAAELVMAGGPRRPAKGSSRAARKSGKAGQEKELLARKKLRLSVWTEVGIGVAVLAITSILVATPPGSRPAAADAAPAPQAEATPTSPPEVVSRELSLDGGGRVVIQFEPARVGENTVAVTILDPSNKAWDVPEVTASLSLAAQGIGPLPVTLRETHPGDYISTGLSIPLAGTWQLQVKVRTTEIDQVTADTTVQVYQ